MYESYEDWYDNGPGSENFKRKVLESEREFYSQYEVVVSDGFIGFKKKKSESKKK